MLLKALAGIALTATLAGAQQQTSGGPTLRDWMSLASVDGPVIAPDGKRVAYLLVTPDWSRNDFTRQIMVGGTDGSAPRQVTDTAAPSWSPRWSPDGKWLAFLSARGGGVQVYLAPMPPADGAPVQLTQAENGVDDFRWAPNGQQIAYLSSERVAKPTPEPKEFHVVGNDAKYSAALWIVEVPAQPAMPQAGTRITDPAAFVADEIVWSPDSRRIAMHANSWDAPYPFYTYDVYVIDVGSKTATRITDTPGPDFWPVWSPDGREIAYRTYYLKPGDTYDPHSQGYLAIVPADGGERRIVTEGFDEMATPVAWTADGLYFTGRQRTYQHLFRVDPRTRAIQRITEPFESITTAVSFAADGRTIAFAGSDASRYQEIYTATIGTTWRPIRLTRMGDQLSSWRLATRSVVSWKSRDGLPIEGVLLTPPNLDRTRRYPLVLIVHGGPQDVDQAIIHRDFPYVAEAYAQRGFVVLRPNYRGSIGYGKGFREALAGNQGIKEYEDLVGGVELLVEQGLVDSAHVGVMGWSHGGYIAAFASAYGDRFSAISVGAGVSDVRLFYTLGGGATLQPTRANPRPWDEPELYRRISPLTWVKRARTPTLIQHGERDNVAPMAGARELYQALKDQGVPTRLIIYNGAGHLPSGLKQFEMAAQHNLDWFTQWLQSGKGAP